MYIAVLRKNTKIPFSSCVHLLSLMFTHWNWILYVKPQERQILYTLHFCPPFCILSSFPLISSRTSFSLVSHFLKTSWWSVHGHTEFKGRLLTQQQLYSENKKTQKNSHKRHTYTHIPSILHNFSEKTFFLLECFDPLFNK